MNKENVLVSIIDKSYRDEELTNQELNMLTRFLELYIDAKENNIEVHEEFDFIMEKWYENSSIDQKFPNEKMSEIYERIRIYRKNRVKIYEPDINDLGNGAFISTFAILESGLVIGLITALIMLFK